MGRRTEKRKIGRFEYEVTQLGSEKGTEMLTRVLQLASPVFAKLLSGRKGEMTTSEALGSMSASALAETLQEVGSRLKYEDVSDFCEVFGPTSKVTLGVDKKTGKPRSVFLDERVRDDHFAGEYLEMMKWLGFCLEVNYRNFFKGIVSGTSAPTESEIDVEEPEAMTAA